MSRRQVFECSGGVVDCFATIDCIMPPGFLSDGVHTREYKNRNAAVDRSKIHERAKSNIP